MQYVFWQNVLSIHQSAFLRNLSSNNDVLLVAESELKLTRLKDGWSIPEFGQVKVIIAPNKEKIQSLLEDYKNAVHVFSGLSAFPMVHYAFNCAVRKSLKIGVMLEPFNWIGIKGFLRQIKYCYLRLKYDKHISFLLTTGEIGRLCYEKVKFSTTKIFDWGYFTETPMGISKRDNVSGNKINVLFIGAITSRKNILTLVDICLQNIVKEEFVLHIVGTGDLENILLEKIDNLDGIIYHGGVDNKEIYPILLSSDLLILPSIFDGWGAVVNEALMCGTPVIASDYCGSSVLLDGNYRGEVFSIKENNLEEILKKWILKGKLSENSRTLVKEWAENNISGSVAANYFEKIIAHILSGKERPIAPWLDK